MITLDYIKSLPELVPYAHAIWRWRRHLAAADLTVLHEATTRDCTGGLFFVLTDGKRFGFLELNYGTCGGCDPLIDAIDGGWERAGGPEAEIKYVLDTLEQIHWFNYRQELATWLSERDWATLPDGQYSCQEVLPEILTALGFPLMELLRDAESHPFAEWWAPCEPRPEPKPQWTPPSWFPRYNLIPYLPRRVRHWLGIYGSGDFPIG